MFIRIFVLLSLLLSACARVGTINMEKHSFGEVPKKIIWLQIAGLDMEHMSMLRFWNRSSFYKTSFESFPCLGQMWNYNLYDLRPKAHLSFLSQITGSKNVKGSCEDYTKKPVWSYLSQRGYKTGVFEIGASKGESLDQKMNCSKIDKSYTDLTIWKMSSAPNKSVNFFHYQEKANFSEGKIYYDRSCKNNVCYANFYDNIKRIYPALTKKYSKMMFLIRDFSYLKALKTKKISNVKEVLMDLDKLISYFNMLASKTNDTLLIVSTAEVVPIEFPTRGNNWLKFEQSGKYSLFKRSSLSSLLLAKGPGAENFCGVYGESEFVKRLLFAPEYKSIFGTVMGVFSE